MPIVSVIIATHNRATLLPRAVKSAQESGTDVEVIVVDDASTDETAEVCRGMSGIRYLRVERNQREGGARNIGIINSTGDYLTFLDDDDVRLPGSIDLQLKALTASPEAGLIYGQAFIADQNGLATNDFYPPRCPQGDVFWELLSQNFIPCGTVLFSRSCLYRTGLLDESVPGVEDWDLWVRIASLYQVIAVDQPLMVWRKSTPASQQATSRAAQMAKMSGVLLRRKWLKLPRAAAAPRDQRRHVRQEFSRNLASHLVFETARALAIGHFSGAQKNALAALRLHPLASVRVAIRCAVRFLSATARGISLPADLNKGFMHYKRTKASK